MVYDLLVIGGGPAGYLAAERAGEAGFSVALFEKRYLGGVCLNEGCIPSKTLLHSAKIYDYARYSEKYGVKSENVSLDHGVVLKRKEKVVRTLVTGIRAKLTKYKVKIVEAEAVIKGRNGEDFVVSAGGEDYAGKRILIATGSVPVIPPIEGVREGVDSGFVLTNREILDLTEIPESLVVIGGGVIGLEMASYFNSAGSKVTIIEMLDHIAGETDREISELLLADYIKKGIDIKLGAKVTAIGNGKVMFEKDNVKSEISCGKVLMSVGRKPVTQGIGLETVGVEVERGAVRTDESCRTNIPNVYAAGDVNGRSLLAHTAYREAEVSVNNMLNRKDRVRYNAIPAVIYTNPEVASIGETAESARKKGIDAEEVKLSMRYSGRYVAENEGGNGIIKLVVDKKYRTLVGVHMIGNYSSEIIYGAAVMIETEMRIEDIKEIVFPHPTVSEVIREGIFAAGELL
jgi:dihydrolipoamide dehydrogenase